MAPARRNADPLQGTRLNGQIVEQTRYGLHPEEVSAALNCLKGPHRGLHGRSAFVGLNRFCVNYFHVLTQIIPAVAAYETEPGFQDGLLLLGAPDATLYRALELAGISTPETMVMAPVPPVSIADLTFSSLLTEHNGPSLFCRSVYDRMIERVKAPRWTSTPRSIYVWRYDSNKRPMRNEIDLIMMLLRYDIEPVVLSTLSLDEQITLFHHARLVIGPHGAGLANVVFATPGAVLYELLPDHYISPCISQLAQLRGLHYWCDVHKGEARPGLWHHHTPWTVDIDAVERRVVEILSTYDLAA